MENIDINNLDIEYFTTDEINNMYDNSNRYEDLVEIQQENWG